jgi:hypothetical protein
MAQAKYVRNALRAGITGANAKRSTNPIRTAALTIPGAQSAHGRRSPSDALPLVAVVWRVA